MYNSGVRITSRLMLATSVKVLKKISVAVGRKDKKMIVSIEQQSDVLKRSEPYHSFRNELHY